MIFLALALVSSTSVSPVRVNVQLRESLECAGSVRAQLQADPATVVTAPLAGTTAVLQVPQAGRWQISLDTKTCWAAPALVDVNGSEMPAIQLRTWAKGEMSGMLSVRPGQRLPETLQVELRPAVPAGRPVQGDPLATSLCQVTERQWHCDAPVMDLDARIMADGFAPAYLWNIAFSNGRASLPEIALQPGASLSGWVEDQRGKVVSAAEVRLAPRQLSNASARASGLSHQGATVLSNDRGFFQFQSLSSGDYTVIARTRTKGVSESVELTIRNGVEHVLPAAVIVEPAATVVVQITPPLSPDRKPWNVRLQRILVADGALDPRATGRATELGTWSVEGVERGPYSIEVFDSAGSTVARLQQEIRRDTATIDVQVGRVRVEGRLRFGTEPVSAELEFFTRASNVVMHSDEDGVFAGWLPNEGPWGVQIIPKGELQRLRARVDVHVPSDATRATVDIDLPNGRIEGMVVDEAGNAVPKSGLIVLKGSEVLANTGTDGDGRFVVRGLETGPVVLFAKRGELFSDYQKAQITTESGEKETVVLRAPTELTGKLVHPSGAAVIGALIRYLRNSEILTAVSGPTGGFALNLAFDADFADLIVMTPGRPVVLDRVRLGREKAFVVVPEVAAELRILPRIGASLPWISKAQGPLFPLTLLFGPRQGLEQPREFSNGVITLQVAPGMYNVCYSYSVAADCVAVAARAGEVTRAVPPTNVGAK